MYPTKLIIVDLPFFLSLLTDLPVCFDLPFTSKASGSNYDGHARGLAGAIWNYYGSSNPYGNYGWYPLHIQLTSGAANNVILYIVGYNSQNSNWGPIGNLIGNNAQITFSFLTMSIM